MIVLWAVLVMFGVSLTLGLIIAIFGRVFEVKSDPRVEKIIEVLPAYNCGSCGYPGCSQYADAIVEKDEAVNKCTPGGPEVTKKIQAVMAEKPE